MNNEIITKRKLKNAEGKRLLEKTRLEYSREIIIKLQEDPIKLNEVLTELEITEADFLNYLSGVENANITFYDQALTLVKKKEFTKNNNK